MKAKMKRYKELDKRTEHELYWGCRDLNEIDEETNLYKETLEHVKALCEQAGAKLLVDSYGCYYYEIL